MDTAANLQRLLDRMAWLAPLAMLVVALVVGLSLYLFQVRPLTQDGVDYRQIEARQRVSTKVEDLLGQVERLLLTMQEWSRDGLLTLDDPEMLNRVLMPALGQRVLISSAHLASDEGRELLLLKVPEGWRNRITFVDLYGKQQRWLHWSTAGRQTRDEWLEQDYDPRKRPWYTGALANPENKVHWTSPYIFQSTRDPGVTASVQWRDARTGKRLIVALDVLLTELSRFTATQKFGTNGQVALLTADGALLGLPRAEGFDSDDAIRKAVLRTPRELGLPLLDAAVSQPERDGQDFVLPARLAGDSGVDWIVNVQPLNTRNLALRLATLAPVRDFSPWSAGLVLTLVGTLALIVLAAVLLAQRVQRGVSVPLQQVFADLERSNRQLSVEMTQSAAAADIAARLQRATDDPALAQALLCGLAERIALAQGALYRWNSTLGQLELCGAFAADADMPRRVLPGEGLLGQCAADRAPIVLTGAPVNYVRVHSALTEGTACSLLLLPVLNNGVLLGVVELATLHPLSDEARKLVDSVLAPVALCMEILARTRAAGATPLPDGEGT